MRQLGFSLAIAAVTLGCQAPMPTSAVGQATFHVLAAPSAAPTVRHPQEPHPPYPYFREEVRLRNRAGNFALAGTLLRPHGPGPFPAIVIITGSGEQTRKVEMYDQRPYAYLADQLVRRGYAVLHMDDRGVGASGGQAIRATSADYATDVVAEVRYLEGRRDIDRTRVGLMGHSEGGWIAPAAASQHPVAFMILLAPPGVNGARLLERQTLDKLKVYGYTVTPAERASMRQARIGLEGTTAPRESFRFISRILAPFLRKNDFGRILITEPQLRPTAVLMAVLPWYRYFMHFDPQPYFARVTAPVLVLNGTKDILVAPDLNVPPIQQALASAGNRDVTIRILPGLNHLFQHTRTGALEDYSRLEETMSPEVPRIIGDWLDARFGRQAKDGDRSSGS